jgi:hypothetical protein
MRSILPERAFAALSDWAILTIGSCASVAVMCAWFVIIASSVVAIGVLALAIVIGAASALIWQSPLRWMVSQPWSPAPYDRRRAGFP